MSQNIQQNFDLLLDIKGQCFLVFSRNFDKTYVLELASYQNINLIICLIGVIMACHDKKKNMDGPNLPYTHAFLTFNIFAPKAEEQQEIDTCECEDGEDVPAFLLDLMSTTPQLVSFQGLRPVLLINCIIASFCILTNKNPIYALLSLIAIFFNAIVLLLTLKIEFLALTFLIIYVGAIAILFLFVIMMFNLKKLQSVKVHGG